MSAKGRGDAVGGPGEFYPTPGWCTRRLLEAWRPRHGLIVEPCAGVGSIIEELGDAAAESEILAIDINSAFSSRLAKSGRRVAVHTGDFRDDSRPEWVRAALEASTAVIGNPPFSLALDFIRHSMALCPEADIAFLLRMGIVETDERAKLFADLAPDVYHLPNRPSFNGRGTDASAYAWFVWPRDTRRRGTYQVLELTSREERARDARRSREIMKDFGSVREVD